mgnify:FL=1
MVVEYYYEGKPPKNIGRNTSATNEYLAHNRVTKEALDYFSRELNAHFTKLIAAIAESRQPHG